MIKSKLHWFFLSIFVLVSTGIGVYLYISINNLDFNLGFFVKNLIIFFVLFFGIIFMLIKGVDFLIKKSKDDLSKPKEYVSTDRAKDIFLQELIKFNKIPHFIGKDGLVHPINESAVQVRNTLKYNDPSNQTSDTFFLMEIILKEGTYVGSLIACICIDYGESFIKENWNMRVEWNVSMNTYDPKHKKFPLTSAKNYNERMLDKRISMIEDGYDSDDLKVLIDPYLAQTSQQPIQETKKRNKSELIAPKISDNYPSYFEEEVEEVADLNEDIENYRRANT
jgi:hypothetical protein